MTDDSEPSLEQVTAEIITFGRIRREEVCTRLGIGEDMLEVCLQWEIIQPPEPDPEGMVLFPEDAIDRLSRGLRLHRDLGINWPGVSVALELLDRIEELEQQIHNLSSQ
ncbi:chaperone modulator CbpM [Candidatus Nitrospira allomarina]|jgi:chaperone modulatory protein CbpM|uniref:Chaperone modulator CbpM n=1 Tax=Candidatus Nitrospira allomarina TaxID=3020900 RepID=A0AA96G6Q1_9BACT|nr:chaperone modulator CbpM [Candidatus Nitrospira allomarina]WNM56349.1 chaperone modulator CbpM [Candidatus Nitrospira allomarina]